TEDNWKGLFLTMAQVAGNTNGGISPTFKEGLPNLYCGIFATVLSFLYLLSKDVKTKDKICAVCMLLFFNISFIVRQLDYIWHGFHFTNMIPYRFSFLYSFVILYMGYIAWINRNNLRLGQVAVSALASLGIVLCYKDLNDIVFWAYNGVLLLLYISTLVYHSVHQSEKITATNKSMPIPENITKRRVCSYAFVGIIAVEVVLNLVNFGVNFSPTNASNYPKGKADSAAVIEYMHELEKETPFYRAETTHTQTLNDGALNGYHGITAFTSSANVKVTEFMQSLGYGAKNTYNRYSFEEGSPVANLFLSLKYMIERDGRVEDNAYFDDIYNVKNIHLLKNNAYLPLGFLCNSQILNVDFDIKANRFALQNDLIQQAAGLNADVWHSFSGNSLTIKGTGVDITPQPSTGYCAYTTKNEKNATITYSYTADKSGFVCIDLDLSKRNSYSVYLNNILLYSETHSLPQMISVCDVVPGDVVQVKLKCKENENGTIKIQAAVLNETLFRKAYNNLSSSVLDITSFEDTKIIGTIDCKNDGVLYTSIPQNGNWNAIVDGNPTETVAIGDAMVGLLLSKGSHTIQFVYKNNAFCIGWKISLACLLVFIVLSVLAYKPTIISKLQKFKK
ncbi:MAG: YfhO family protein, partial [Oscillospiraceae bacterium]|nr:YfhO family protein [Oscillospiraceae bacterium]